MRQLPVGLGFVVLMRPGLPSAIHPGVIGKLGRVPELSLGQAVRYPSSDVYFNADHGIG